MAAAQRCHALLADVERLYELADAAELMDDVAGAERLRAVAEHRHRAALRLLDE